MKKNLIKLGLGLAWLGLCYVAIKLEMPTEAFMVIGLIGAPVFTIIFELSV